MTEEQLSRLIELVDELARWEHQLLVRPEMREDREAVLRFYMYAVKVRAEMRREELMAGEGR